MRDKENRLCRPASPSRPGSGTSNRAASGPDEVPGLSPVPRDLPSPSEEAYISKTGGAGLHLPLHICFPLIFRPLICSPACLRWVSIRLWKRDVTGWGQKKKNTSASEMQTNRNCKSILYIFRVLLGKSPFKSCSAGTRPWLIRGRSGVNGKGAVSVQHQETRAQPFILLHNSYIWKSFSFFRRKLGFSVTVQRIHLSDKTLFWLCCLCQGS